MKTFILFILFSICSFNFGYSQNAKAEKTAKDKEEITQLIKQVLTWADAEPIDLIPATYNSDSIATGIDFKRHKNNIILIRKSGFFTEDFITNFNDIITAIDKKIKAKAYDAWYAGELPPFRFTNDVSPWCNCQDRPDTWDGVETKIVDLSAKGGTLQFSLTGNNDSAFKEMRTVSVIKDKNRWKITALNAFDYDNAIKKE